jgi:hypothetical protein
VLTLLAMVLAVLEDGGGVLSIATVVIVLVMATSVVGGGVPSGVRVGVEGIVVGGSTGVVGITVGVAFGLARCSRSLWATSNRFWVPLTIY